MEYRTVYPSPLGPLTLASDGCALTGLWMAGQRYFGGRSAEWVENDDFPLFSSVAGWLDAYWAGEMPDPGELPLAPGGTPFQIRVWQCLLEIPYGQVRTYGEVAAMLGCGSPRAVGGAVGRNPISIIIPCHRVIGADGGLTGYAGGTERKRWLLEHECDQNGENRCQDTCK